MPSTFAESSVVLLLDRKNFDAQFAGLRQDITSSLSNIGQVASGMLAASGVAKAVDMVKTLGAQFINTNSSLEQYSISLGVMLKSQDQANKLIRDVEQLAAKSPFSTDGLLKSVQLLKAYGFEVQRLVPMMRTIGDAAAASPGGMEFGVQKISLALGQIQAKGKLSAQEMGQLTEAGVPAWEALASAIGTTVGDAMDRTTKGAIDSKTAIDALLKGMDDRFGGMMEKQSHSWAGLLSTFKDFGEIISRKIGQPIFELAKVRLENLVAWADSPAIEQWLTNVLPQIQLYATGLFSAADGAVRFVTEHQELLASIAKGVALMGAIKVSSVALTAATALATNSIIGLRAASLALFGPGALFAAGVVAVGLLGTAFAKAAAEGITFSEALGDIVHNMAGLKAPTEALKATEQFEKDFAKRNSDEAMRKSRELRGAETPAEKAANAKQREADAKRELDERNRKEDDELIAGSKRAAPLGQVRDAMRKQNEESQKVIDPLEKRKQELDEEARKLFLSKKHQYRKVMNSRYGGRMKRITLSDEEAQRELEKDSRFKELDAERRGVKVNLGREQQVVARRNEELAANDLAIRDALSADLKDKRMKGISVKHMVGAIVDMVAGGHEAGNRLGAGIGGLAGRALEGVRGLGAQAGRAADEADRQVFKGAGLTDKEIAELEKKTNRNNLINAQVQAAARMGLDPNVVLDKLENRNPKVQQFSPEDLSRTLQTALAPKDPLEKEAQQAAKNMAADIKNIWEKGVKLVEPLIARAG